jgi:hypothetical protein
MNWNDAVVGGPPRTERGVRVMSLFAKQNDEQLVLRGAMILSVSGKESLVDDKSNRTSCERSVRPVGQ